MTDPSSSVHGRHSCRHGLMLLVVLVTLVTAALTGVAALYLAQAERSSARVASRLLQSRAAAWSGVQAVMAELAAQREELLRGAEPKVTGSFTLDEPQPGATGRATLFRIVQVNGRDLVSEAAKLNVNHASTAAMANLPGSSESLAATVVQARAAGPLMSIGDVPAIFAALPPEGQSLTDEPTWQADPAGGDAPAGHLLLADLLTVFSTDPTVQTGAADSSETGRRRVLLDPALIESLTEALRRGLDDQMAPRAAALAKATAEAATEGEVVTLLQQNGVKPEHWAGLLDLLTVVDGDYIAGRIDLLRAAEPTLVSIPGFDSAAASKAVQLRDKLDSEVRASPTWLVTEEIMTAEQFAAAIDYVCCRSLQWRVRIEAGTMRVSESGDALGFAPDNLEDRVLVEAVIDVASRRPRVAYLRDITHLELARSVEQEKFIKEDGDREGSPTSENSDAAESFPEPAPQDRRFREAGSRNGIPDAEGEISDGDRSTAPDIGEQSGAEAGVPPAARKSARPGSSRVGRWNAGERTSGGSGRHGGQR
ncbi:MAG: hypothetical protein H7Y88_11400 [Phycisphaerales bacterium]|nr:hypothetical protein [Phycisphaerales bacterium]